MISVIIVNYNRKDLLKKCLDSVRGQSFQDIEIIVVDNASSDDSVEMVETYYPEVKLIWNTQNLLFCKAYNQGIDEARGDFILCLNNDAILDKDYLKEALFTVSMDTKIGMVSGKVLRMDKETIDSTGLFLGRNRKAIERGYGKKDRGQFEKPGYVFGTSGACAFFRRRMLLDTKDENGYFDERFGMYYEDLDLCWRAQKKGWKAYYTPKARAYHMRAGTAVIYRGKDALNLPYLPDKLIIRYIINRYRCIKKNDSLCGILINLPFILWYEIKIWGYVVLVFLNLSS
jgi:GT2 family glycosyltransferase